MQYEYPNDYSAADMMPCREDSNILRMGQSGDEEAPDYVAAKRPTVKELEARIKAMEPD